MCSDIHGVCKNIWQTQKDLSRFVFVWIAFSGCAKKKKKRRRKKVSLFVLVLLGLWRTDRATNQCSTNLGRLCRLGNDVRKRSESSAKLIWRWMTSTMYTTRRAPFVWNFHTQKKKCSYYDHAQPLLLWFIIPVCVNSHCVIPQIYVTVLFVTEHCVILKKKKKKDTSPLFVCSLWAIEITEERRHSSGHTSLCDVRVTLDVTPSALSSFCRVRATPVAACKPSLSHKILRPTWISRY